MQERNIHWPRHIPTLLTKRFRLRRLQFGDANDYFEINKNPLVMKAYGIRLHRKIMETRQLIHWLEKQFKDRALIRWGIEERPSRRIIGDIGFWRFVPIRARGELGAKLHPNYWSSGVMTEAMTAVLDYAFGPLGLQSVEGNIEVANRPSIQLVRKLHFKRIGVIPKHSYSISRRAYVDTILFSLTRDEWIS